MSASPRSIRCRWNPLNDLEPIARLPVSSLMIVGKTGCRPTHAKELIAWLKANPDKATAASVGAGSGAHICGLYFMDKTGTNFQFVQYRGGAPAMQDLVGNQIDLMCAEASQTLAHVRGGKMKAFAVMAQDALDAAARRADDGGGRRDRHDTSSSGTACGRRRARPRTSSPSSTPRWSRRSTIRRCRSASTRSA